MFNEHEHCDEMPLDVAVFAYARPEHLRRCLLALSCCPEGVGIRLTIFCDGPPQACSPELHRRISETRQVARSGAAFAATSTIVEADANQGVSRAVPAGIEYMLSRSESVVVVEDDIEVGPSFLSFMRQALTLYRNDKKVMAVSGYSWPTFNQGVSSTYFLRFAHYWGWATWKRAWQCATFDGRKLRKELNSRRLTRRFNQYSVFPRSSMDILNLYIDGTMGIWDICWSASVFLSDGFCLYPRQSLLRNNGFDGSGEHCRPFNTIDFGRQSIASRQFQLERIPVAEDKGYKEGHQKMRNLLRDTP